MKFLPLRIQEKIELALNGCWLWTGTLQSQGYGLLAMKPGKPQLAHRVLYELLVGPIPARRYLDHLCRMPRCVNPGHLQPVTHQMNLVRASYNVGWCP